MSERVLIVTPAAVLDAVGRAVVATDTAGTILFWNRGAELLYGWTADEAVGRNAVELLVPESLAGEAGAVLDRVNVGEEWSGDFHVCHKDGHTLRVAVVDQPVLDEAGQVVAVVSDSQDVAAERLLQQELRSTRDEQRLALAAGRLGILRWDRETSGVTLDATAEALLGLQPGQFDGRFETWAQSLHPDDRDRVRTTLDRAVEIKGAYDLEYRVVWPDGSVHWLQGRGQVTLDEHGVVTGRIGCMADISARRTADEERAHLLAVERTTRSEAETVATRLRGMQAVTMSLLRAVDARSVAEAVLAEGVPAVGGRTGSICLLAEDGATVEIVHEIGYRDDVKDRWHAFPLDADLPASEAIRTGQTVLMRSPEDRDARYPIFRGTPMVSDSAYAVVPLIDENGITFGAMVVGFPEPRDFNGAELRVLSALSAQAATALRRATLYEEAREAVEAEHEARLDAERAQDRLAFLTEASFDLASSVLDLETTLARVVELAVPRLADGCAIHLVDERGVARALAAAHLDPSKAPALQVTADTLDAGGIGAVIRTGRPEIHRRLSDDDLRRLAAGADQLDALRAAGFGAMAVLPLLAQGRSVGALTLVAGTGRRLDEADLQLAGQLAVRAATAIDNARLFADRTRVARSLQASLLPPSLPSIPGLELGARYAPAGEGVEVGGDFYDAFALEGGRWLLVVGDVRGKGVDAAAVTGLARHTIRSIALYEARPSAILAHLNRVLLSAEGDRVAAIDACNDPPWELTEPRFCTVALAIVEPGEGGAEIVVCSGGHPLPLVARADGRIEAAGRPGSLLGASPDIELHDVLLELGPGESLVCFTDGIIERHQGRTFFDEAGIAKVLAEAAAAHADAATIAARIEQEARNLFADKPQDDMAVLVVRVPR
ncbi:MAG TPA: SpoIIE family protein phosphatase [Acidimicrobiales bacterium]|nr:SpoIIE family protein phosphatase [Acidimicrobiales bacterium]